MNDAECSAFLQWALPRLRLRWTGFRKVRRQVCRRLRRRLTELSLDDLDAYRRRLDRHPDEWPILDRCCRITISRFYRDRAAWDHLGRVILPALAEAAREGGRRAVRAWSAGCASGEEPYGVAILWRLEVAPRFPGVALRVAATDADPHLLARAMVAVYPAGSLRELPMGLRDRAFRREGDRFRLRADLREGVGLVAQDLRSAMPAGPFDLVLNRNLAFTYFDEGLQSEVLQGLVRRLRPGGFLAIGGHEALPAAGGWSPNLEPAGRCFFRRTGSDR